NRDTCRLRARGEADRRIETTVTSAEQNRYVVAADIGNGEVEFAVVVEIRGCDGDRLGPHCEVDTATERTGTVAKKNRNVVVVAGIGDRQVELAIAVEVTHRHRLRSERENTRRTAGCRRERYLRGHTASVAR